MRSLPAVTASAAFLALLIAAPADAAVTYKHKSQNPSTACTLTKPTTDSPVRGQATGFRNQGTANVYALCGFDKESLAAGGPYAGFVKIWLNFVAFDGAAHTFNCTGVARDPSNSAGIYLTKPAYADATGGSVEFNIYDVIYSGYNLDQRSQSITCTLPPGVAILGVESDYGDMDGMPMACSNGIDDDIDGLADAQDPGCSSSRGFDPSDNNEADDNPLLPACSDGIDNDGDGKTDYMDDPQCSDSTDPNEMYFGS